MKIKTYNFELLFKKIHCILYMYGGYNRKSVKKFKT